ncbi:MAG TPA: WHG domain-containing protein [Solirubrobacteraceae bacterium]|nr:WHG domain-containing protein [Solirubrobacteraceae bacterium]
MPRAGLTESKVVDEAQRIADEIGLASLTLAALAGRLGVRQPSLYKHIDGMAGLQRSLAVRAKNELADVLARAAVGRERGDAICSISSAYRRWALEHPGRYAAAQRARAPGDADDTAASMAVVGVAADVLAGYELRDNDAIDATRALRSALHGFVTLEAGGGFGLPVDIDRSFDRLVRGLTTALANWAADTATGAEAR